MEDIGINAAKKEIEPGTCELLGRLKVLGFQALHDILKDDPQARGESSLEVIQTLINEIGKMEEENKRIYRRYNLLYIAMTEVWGRLGFRKGTWEEKLEQVRSWARAPERAMQERIFSSTSSKADTHDGSKEKGDEAGQGIARRTRT